MVRKALQHFIPSYEVTMLIQDVDNYKKTIPSDPFGLCKEFWSEIMACMGQISDSSKTYTLMLFPDQWLETPKFFMDFFGKFGSALNECFDENEGKIDLKSFSDVVKKTLPLLLGGL